MIVYGAVSLLDPNKPFIGTFTATHLLILLFRSWLLDVIQLLLKICEQSTLLVQNEGCAILNEYMSIRALVYRYC